VVERLGTMRDAETGTLGRRRRRLRHAYAWTAHNLLGPMWGLVKNR